MKSAEDAKKETESMISDIDQEKVKQELDVIEKKIDIAILCKEYCTIHKVDYKSKVQQAALAEIKKQGYKVFSINLPFSDGPYVVIGWLEGTKK